VGELSDVPSAARARAAGALAAVLACAVATTACADPRETALADVSDVVRAHAHASTDHLADLVAGQEELRGRALLDHVLYHWPSGPDVIVFSRAVRADGGVTIGTAHHAHLERSISFSSDRFVARICVEHSAGPGPDPGATVVDVGCPAGLPDATGNAGNIDVTVTLRD
jgi:hypothetical protein